MGSRYPDVFRGGTRVWNCGVNYSHGNSRTDIRPRICRWGSDLVFAAVGTPKRWHNRVRAIHPRPLSMSDKDKRTKDDPAQSKRFIETARQVEADESRKGADRAFEKLRVDKPTN